MKKYTSKITSKSIEQSGLPNGYKAISEYIWNGFDAGASKIQINYTGNEIGYLMSFSISDNGSGISLSTIEDTFGRFQDSNKKNVFSKTGFIKGEKGKGRFAFTTFSNKAIWSTVFKEKDKYLQYSIHINRENSEHYFIPEEKKIVDVETSTIVSFEDFHSLTKDVLENEEFTNFLSSEFGWFLFLNQDEEYDIAINGFSLNYFDKIADNEIFNSEIENTFFKVNYIRWSCNIGDKYYNYFLNSEKSEVYKTHTSFNNTSIDFHHSLYIESEYFDEFDATKEDRESLFKNQKDVVFKKLQAELKEFLEKKRKEFLRNDKAEGLIQKYDKDNILPKFKNTSYDRMREKDLKKVIKAIYITEPKIFFKLNNHQSKTLISFINLLLDSEERDKILIILEDIVKMSDDERAEFASILERTKLTHIISLIKLLENRYRVVEKLKLLIYDLEKFTNERDHIQVVIENNYWLFGEQYHHVSADVNFETTLSNYLKFTEENDRKPSKSQLNHKEKLRRPDLLICQKTDVSDLNSNDSLLEENIIVELKRPSVIIGKKEFRQIEDYMNFIIEDEAFNSQLRLWKFILVGKKVDDFVKGLYTNQENKGKKFLIQSVKNYEIYAITWDDLFMQFKIRHKNLLERLEYKDTIKEELIGKGVDFDKTLTDNLTVEMS